MNGRRPPRYAVSRSALLALALASACATSLPEDEPVVPTPTEVGTPNGTPVSATLGAAGGTLATSDARFSVVIPPGALAADTVISIQPITNTAHGGRGDGYALSPDGQTFAQPIELRWQPTGDDLDGSAIEYASIDRQDDEGYWEVLEPTLDGGVVTVSTPHFSHYSPSISLYIDPRRAEVRVGEQQSFQVWLRSDTYLNPDSPDRTFSSYERAWDTARADRSLGDWSVNDVVGGNATVGTATRLGPGRVSFSAPRDVPSDNPVRLQVPVRSYRDRPVAPLVRRIRVVGEGQPYEGTVTWDERDFVGNDGARYMASVRFISAQTLTHYTDYEVEGSVAIEIRQPDCMPRTLTLPVSANPALGDLIVWSSGTDPMTYGLSINTDITHADTQCSIGTRMFTRTLSVTASVDCHGIPYTDATTLSTMDASTWCGSATNVGIQLTQQ